MGRLLEYLETKDVQGDMVYVCIKCGHELGPVKNDYKGFASKRTVPISKAQPEFLASYAVKSDTFVMREYFCPVCGVMFEVDMVKKDEPQIHSIEPKV
ncbi:MAG: acetone carboxylase subunit gamma [Pseudomonadota bacterium]